MKDIYKLVQTKIRVYDIIPLKSIEERLYGVHIEDGSDVYRESDLINVGRIP